MTGILCDRRLTMKEKHFSIGWRVYRAIISCAILAAGLIFSAAYIYACTVPPIYHLLKRLPDGLDYLVISITLPVPGLLAIGWVLQRHTRARQIKGMCKACRYDMRGNTDGICPECGSTIGPDLMTRHGR